MIRQIEEMKARYESEGWDLVLTAEGGTKPTWFSVITCSPSMQEKLSNLARQVVESGFRIPKEFQEHERTIFQFILSNPYIKDQEHVNSILTSLAKCYPGSFADIEPVMYWQPLFSVGYYAIKGQHGHAKITYNFEEALSEARSFITRHVKDDEILMVEVTGLGTSKFAVAYMTEQYLDMYTDLMRNDMSKENYEAYLKACTECMKTGKIVVARYPE